MPKQAVRKKPASDRSIRKDGFVFASSGLDAILVDYLYKQVPEGKRRDQMKRLMLLGLMQELGIQSDKSSFIPPRPIEMSERVHPSTLDDPFLGRSKPTETFNNKRSRLIENDKDEALTVYVRTNLRPDAYSAGDNAVNDDPPEDNKRSKMEPEQVVAEPESSDDTFNGLNIQALMAFKG